MYIKDYVEATHKVLGSNANTGEVIASLSTYLKRRGLLKLYPAILRGVLQKGMRKEKTLTPKIIVARETDLQRHKTEIEALIPKKNQTTTVIDPTLIGGFIIKTKDTYTDQSHKSKLLHAYHRIIN